MKDFPILCLINFLIIYLLVLFRILVTIVLDLSNVLHDLQLHSPMINLFFRKKTTSKNESRIATPAYKGVSTED